MRKQSLFIKISALLVCLLHLFPLNADIHDAQDAIPENFSPDFPYNNPYEDGPDYPPLSTYDTEKSYRTLRDCDAELDFPPFEKIYVSPSEILCTPYGSYYRTAEGELQEVRSIQRDGRGTYVIKINHLCPICGRYCCGKTPPEGYTCPLWAKEVYPHLWINP